MSVQEKAKYLNSKHLKKNRRASGRQTGQIKENQFKPILCTLFPVTEPRLQTISNSLEKLAKTCRVIELHHLREEERCVHLT